MPDSRKHPGAPVQKTGEHEHNVLGKFMDATERAAKILVFPHRGDISAPVVHKHDEYEEASEEELRTFEVETDSEGHHYAVRKSDEEH
ncbi:hypothetical protein [Sinomonas albida]|uniref:hypothetical protein n=1 Tax=Sinomonas albida TaxID=369942 RepID=UPI003AFB2C1A